MYPVFEQLLGQMPSLTDFHTSNIKIGSCVLIIEYLILYTH